MQEKKGDHSASPLQSCPTIPDMVSVILYSQKLIFYQFFSSKGYILEFTSRKIMQI